MLCPPTFFPFNGCNSYILDILGTICLSILVIEFDVYKIISTTSLAVNAFVINLLSGLMRHCLACSVQVRRRGSGFRFDPPDPKNKQKKNLNTFPLELLFFFFSEVDKTVSMIKTALLLLTSLRGLSKFVCTSLADVVFIALVNPKLPGL